MARRSAKTASNSARSGIGPSGGGWAGGGRRNYQGGVCLDSPVPKKGLRSSRQSITLPHARLREYVPGRTLGLSHAREPLFSFEPRRWSRLITEAYPS